MKTSIRISVEIKDKLRKFGLKGESYDAILRRLCESAAKSQLHHFLLNENGTISVSKALEDAKKKWPM